jgi:hypothetical protein
LPGSCWAHGWPPQTSSGRSPRPGTNEQRNLTAGSASCTPRSSSASEPAWAHRTAGLRSDQRTLLARRGPPRLQILTFCARCAADAVPSRGAPSRRSGATPCSKSDSTG